MRRGTQAVLVRTTDGQDGTNRRPKRHPDGPHGIGLLQNPEYASSTRSAQESPRHPLDFWRRKRGGDKAGRIRRARRNRQCLARGWREINRWGCGRIWQDMGVGKDEDVAGDSHVSSASGPPEDDWGATKSL
ncbi:hypothetical protein K523DRAFT_124411 [Schizophyllum commune Tattone D]|nr:hypothetical protein K523DRAFT_124411 [Schizophyllum commune Tattone D]